MSSALVLATVILVVSADRNTVPFTRVRSTQPYTTTLLREAYERSPTFRDLVDALQQSNATVVVQLGACRSGRFRSCVVSVSGSQVARHIWIKVDPHTIHDRLLATIAHELQHAVEIVEHSDVIDAASVVRLYRALSFGKCRDGLSEECETERALATERQVLEELSRTPRLGSSQLWLRFHANTKGTKTEARCPPLTLAFDLLTVLHHRTPKAPCEAGPRA